MKAMPFTCAREPRRNLFVTRLGENTAPSIFLSTRTLDAHTGETIDEAQRQEIVALA